MHGAAGEAIEEGAARSMKRPQLVLVLVVFTAVLVGILVEHRASPDPFAAHEFSVARRIPFEPLVAPLGDQELRALVLDPAGAPAEGVVVHLLPAAPAAPTAAGEPARPLAWGISGPAGEVRLRDVAAGAYRAVLVRPGHPSAAFEVEVPAAQELLWELPAPFAPVASLPAVETAPLLGRLEPPRAGVPVEGYEIVLRPAEDAEEGADPWSGAVTRRVATDAEGFFRLDDLALGAYRAQVLPAWASGGTWPVLDELPWRHAGAAAPLSLRLPGGEIAGTALDLDLRPIEGALVLVAPEGRPQELWPPLTTPASGEFLVADLPAGRYAVQLLAGAARYEELVEVRPGARTRLLPPPLETSRAAAELASGD